MKSIKSWALVASSVHPASRASKYATWRKLKAIPEEWIAAIEKDYPAIKAPKAEKPLPSVGQVIVNAGKSAIQNVLNAAMGGRVFRNPEEVAKVHEICKSCPTGEYRESDDRCSNAGCGCFTTAKAWLNAEKCPSGHWK